MIRCYGKLAGRLEGRRWGYSYPHAGGHVLQSHDNTVICCTDGNLVPLWQCPLPASRGRHAVAADGRKVAASLSSSVCLVDRDGGTLDCFEHLPWGVDAGSGACSFDEDGEHLWAAVPTPRGIDLVVLTVDGLREVDRTSVDSFPVGLHPLHHPDRRTIGWSVGEGQDRSLAVWSRLAGGGIELRVLPDDDRVLAAIHPDGTEYLTTPHQSGPILRHSFLDDRVVGHHDAVGEWRWDFVAGYLDRDLIVATTDDEEGEEMLLLEREPLTIVGNVELAGSINSWASPMWIGNGKCITVGDAAAELWMLADLAPLR